MYSDWEHVTFSGRAFQVFGPATGKARLPTNYTTTASPEEHRCWKQTANCYGCRVHGQFKKECPNRGDRDSGNIVAPVKVWIWLKIIMLAARPVHAEESRTFMEVRSKSYRIWALLDTGSDATIVNRLAPWIVYNSVSDNCCCHSR